MGDGMKGCKDILQIEEFFENEELRQIGLSDSKLRYLVQTVCLVTIGAFDMLRKKSLNPREYLPMK